MQREELNLVVCNLFGEETILLLKKFAEMIDREKPDIIILMARKALYLFELFDYIGIKHPDGEIVSDRILDLETEYFTDKKVIVVDDALVIGTTLQQIKRKLVSRKIDHRIFVFSADEENWRQEIIAPDYIQRMLPSPQLLDFSLTEVKAFEVTSTPFHIDFPSTNYMEIDEKDFSTLHANNDFLIVCTKKDYAIGYEKHSVLFGESVQRSFCNYIGIGCNSIIDLIKVRVYISQRENNVIRLKFVPIVLLNKVNKTTIDKLFLSVISNIDSKEDYESVLKLIENPKVRLRFIQYYLSVCLGLFFSRYYFPSIKEKIKFRSTEIIDLFGKRLTKIFEPVFSDSINFNLTEITDNRSEEDLENMNDIFGDIAFKPYSILTGFQQIFINLTDRREVKARGLIVGNETEPHFQDRLSSSVSFEQISTYICTQLNIEPSMRVKSILSVCLDICNDLGISNPITRVSNGYYFRAYRHGELAKRTLGNIYLLYTFIMSFCDERKYNYQSGFDKLLLEKIAVFFYRIGTKSRFLDVTDNYSDMEAVQIGFYLMGAILKENRKGDFFPNDAQDWFLMNHCGELFVKRNNKYFLNKIPDTRNIHLKDGAKLKSKMLGRTLGRLLALKKRDIQQTEQGQPLNINRLTILVSCYSAGDLCLALGAELNIICTWMDQFRFKENISINNRIFNDKFKSTTVYQAINQAYFKMHYSTKEGAKSIIDDSTRYLECLGDMIIADTWQEFVPRLKIGDDEILEVDKIAERRIGNYIFSIFEDVSLYGIDIIFIRFLLEVAYDIRTPKIRIGSSFLLQNNETQVFHWRKLVKKPAKELVTNEISCYENTGRAFWGQSCGRNITINKDAKKYTVRIIRIDNRGSTFNSQTALEHYYNNIQRILSEFPAYKKIAERITSEYIDIQARISKVKENMKYYDTNSALSKIINDMKSRQSRSKDLIEKAVEFYSSSRDNLMKLRC